MIRILFIGLVTTVLLVRCKNNPNQEYATELDTSILHLNSEIEPLIFKHDIKSIKKILDSVKPFASPVRPHLLFFWLEKNSVVKILERDFDSSRHYIQQAHELSQQIHLTAEDQIALNIGIARNLLHQEQYDSALTKALKAQSISVKHHIPNKLVIFTLYLIYDALGDYAKAKYYLTLGFTQSTDAPLIKVYFCLGLSKYFGEKNIVDSALYYYQFVYNDTLFDSPAFKASKEENLGILLTQNGDPAQGLHHIFKAIPVLRETGYLFGGEWLAVAASYYKLKQYEMSLRYLDSVPLYEDTAKNISLARQIWDLKGDNYFALGQLSKAYNHKEIAFDLYTKEKDTLLAKNARDLETRYHLKEKEDKITSLDALNKKESKISRQRKIIIIGMGLVITLAVIIFMLLWKRRQMQLLVRETQLRQQLLRSQMEPHFIFNTLAVLQSLIIDEKPDKSIAFLNKFSSLLRINLENARESLVLLKKEIDALQNYLDLHAMNFEGLFEYRINVYEGFDREKVLIPPMLLQPFVENAIVHGLAPFGQKGSITITVEKQSDHLQCIIEDNGVGLVSNNEEDEKRSLSTMITRERLSLLSRQLKKPAKITILDKQQMNEGQGVKVILDIPIGISDLN